MSVSFILLSTTPTASPPASTWDPRLLHSIEEAANWIHTYQSVEKNAPGEPCDAPPSLSYLRSHIKHLLLVHPTEFFGEEELTSVEQTLKMRNATTEGRCVYCTVLQEEITNGTLNKNETTIGYLNDTCDPSPHEPKRAPWPWVYGIDTRYLRWFLESSFVLEKKKVGDITALRARSWAKSVLIWMFLWENTGKRNHNGNVSLTTPGKEGKEDEIAYEAAKADVTDKRRKEFFEEKLKQIEVYDRQKDRCIAQWRKDSFAWMGAAGIVGMKRWSGRRIWWKIAIWRKKDVADVGRRMMAKRKVRAKRRTLLAHRKEDRFWS
jgi:hypothetical protein